MLRRFTAISKSYNRLIAEKETMLEGAKHSSAATVSFSDAFHPGVEVENNDAVFSSNKELKGQKSIVYDEDEHRFSVSDYQAVVCSFRNNSESQKQAVPTDSKQSEKRAGQSKSAKAESKPQERNKQENKSHE